MISEGKALTEITLEKNKKLQENKKHLNYGRKSEYRDNCIYLQGVTKVEQIIRNLEVYEGGGQQWN